MSLTGNWKITGGEKVEEISDVLGLPEDKRGRLRALLTSDVRDEFTLTATGFHRVTFVNGEKKRDNTVNFDTDVQVPRLLDQTQMVSARFTKVSDSKITGVEKGDVHQVAVCAEATGDKLKFSATVGGVTACLNYARA